MRGLCSVAILLGACDIPQPAVICHNGNCVEPTNFAFVQRDGVPTGPPSPQHADTASFLPNRQTLLMRPGDHLIIHIRDARVPGHPGQRALETSIHDLSTGQRGSMQASAISPYIKTSSGKRLFSLLARSSIFCAALCSISSMTVMAQP